MPTTLATPRSMQEQSPYDSEALEVVYTPAPIAQRSFWSRLKARLAAFQQRPQPMIVAAPPPAMQAVDRLAHDYPFIYIKAMCG